MKANRTLRRTTAALAAAVLLLPVSACGKSDGAASTGVSQPAGSADPHGLQTSGNGYSFVAPRGWIDVTKTVQRSQSQVDTAVSEPHTGNAFTTNVNVIVNNTSLSDPPTETELTDLEKQLVAGIKSMSSDIQVLPRVSIDGSTAVVSGGHLSVNGVKDYLQQYAVPHGGKVYVVSCSFSPDWSSSRRQTVLDEVLASWKWQ